MAATGALTAIDYITFGGLPERSNGAARKAAGIARVGSNPTLTTTIAARTGDPVTPGTGPINNKEEPSCTSDSSIRSASV